MPAGELRRAKEFYLGQLELGLENTMNRMLWVGDNLLSLDRCRTLAEVAEGVENVTANDLMRVAKDIFRTAGINLAVVGPAKSEQDFRKLLSFAGG